MFYNLIEEPQMNFTVNRILTYGERAARLEEVRSICSRISDFDSWFRQWDRLARTAEKEQRLLHTAFYYRMAEFFLPEGVPEKARAFEKCKNHFSKVIREQGNTQFYRIPYEGTFLPAVRIGNSGNPDKTIVVHGGYDSYMEEFYLVAIDIAEKGYTIILFEGPGQGTALSNGLKFTHRWEKPVSSVIDYFQLERAMLLGISWGGYLAPRAAAFEKRISRVICYDFFYDPLDGFTHKMPFPIGSLVKYLIKSGRQKLFNGMMKNARKKKQLIDWFISHGLYITGTGSPFDFFKAISEHRLEDIAHLVTQDVLLLAGEKDHLVPIHHYKKAFRSLRNARSVHGRVFTVAEGGEQHCQVGNIELAIEEILRWIESVE